MRIMIVEMYKNGVHLARRLVADSTAVEHVVLASDKAYSAVPVHDRMEIVSKVWTVPEIVNVAKSFRIELVINFNSIHGFNGLMDALAKENIKAIGSDRKFSATEIDKKRFKEWLHANDFKTPRVHFAGGIERMAERAVVLPYPVVIKPDKQSGPRVAVCQNESELRGYFTKTLERIPYAAHAVTFLAEEYIAIREHLHAGYVICNGQAFMTTAVRMPLDGESARAMGRCTAVLLRYPKGHRHLREISRLINEMPAFGDRAIGAIQCAIDQKGELYFLEHNARPGAHGGLRAMANTYDFITHLHNGDHEGIQRQIHGMNDRVVVGIGLLHAAHRIEVDVQTLSALAGFRFFPNSIVREGDRSFSEVDSVPSLLTVEGNDARDLLNRLETNLATIRATGDYLAINVDDIRRLVES